MLQKASIFIFIFEDKAFKIILQVILKIIQVNNFKALRTSAGHISCQQMWCDGGSGDDDNDNDDRDNDDGDHLTTLVDA